MTHAERLSQTDYYKAFEYGGWDLSLMRDVLKSMELPQDLVESMQNAREADLLVLGSATVRNVDNVAAINRFLRPGQGSNDAVVMIDYNHYPMHRHQSEWRWMESAVRGADSTYADLEYPHFAFGQADMKHLPFGDETFTMVVSDYTLNFLDHYEDVQRTFAEASRVLKPRGTMLLSVAGHPDVVPAMSVDDLSDLSPHQYERFGGLVTSQFPLQMYGAAAAESGFEMRAAKNSGNDYLCAVLQKSA